MSKTSAPRVQGTPQTGVRLGPGILEYLDEKYGLDNVRDHLPQLRYRLSGWSGPLTESDLDHIIDSFGGPHLPVTVKDRADYRGHDSRRAYDPGEHAPVVYYLLFNGLVKIGTSTNLRKRMNALPHDELLATERGSYHVEAERHAQFRSVRYKGEWFRYEGPLREHVEQLRAASDDAPHP